MKNPCTPDCPDRSQSCHGVCDKYAAFVAYREKIRAEQQRDIEPRAYEITKITRALRKRRAKNRKD